MEGEELVGHAGGTASLVLQQLVSGLKVQISSFSLSVFVFQSS